MFSFYGSYYNRMQFGISWKIRNYEKKTCANVQYKMRVTEEMPLNHGNND